MPGIARKTILEKFREMVRRRVPIVGGGAGTGLSAKCEEAGGIDLIIIYNSGRYRMAGRGSAAGLLAFGNANEIVKDMAEEVLPVVRHTPVLAGVNGTDPFVLMPQFLAELKAMGFSGVQNFPTIGLFDGVMRQSFEETGMGYGLEVDMIAAAHQLDHLTTPYVFNPDEAIAMTKAGADIIVAHMGVTVGGSIGATSGKKLDDCVAEIDAIAEAALRVRGDVIVLCHGGPIAMPDDAAFILKHCRNCHGFYGASSMERLPVELALTEQTRNSRRSRSDEPRRAASGLARPGADEHGQHLDALRVSASARSRAASVSIPTFAGSSPVMCCSAGSRLRSVSAVYSYPGQSGPPPIGASIRISGAGKPASANRRYSLVPIRASGPGAPAGGTDQRWSCVLSSLGG